MTLPELNESSENIDTTRPNSPDSGVPSHQMGKVLLAVLQQAASQGRATCSLTACVDLLGTRPDDVMLCVMPTLPHADAAATIQSTLIRAVCQEHSIRVLSVDCDVKLTKAVCEEEKEKVDENWNRVLKTPSPCSEDAWLITGCDHLAPVLGFPCVLVQFPQDPSPEDEVVAEFLKEQMYGQSLTEPYIELPD